MAAICELLLFKVAPNRISFIIKDAVQLWKSVILDLMLGKQMFLKTDFYSKPKQDIVFMDSLKYCESIFNQCDSKYKEHFQPFIFF